MKPGNSGNLLDPLPLPFRIAQDRKAEFFLVVLQRGIQLAHRKPHVAQPQDHGIFSSEVSQTRVEGLFWFLAFFQIYEKPPATH